VVLLFLITLVDALNEISSLKTFLGSKQEVAEKE